MVIKAVGWRWRRAQVEFLFQPVFEKLHDLPVLPKPRQAKSRAAIHIQAQHRVAVVVVARFEECSAHTVVAVPGCQVEWGREAHGSGWVGFARAPKEKLDAC
jgi:hypothetical protein